MYLLYVLLCSGDGKERGCRCSYRLAIQLSSWAAQSKELWAASWAAPVVVATSDVPCLAVEGHMATVPIELIMVEMECSVREPVCHYTK